MSEIEEKRKDRPSGPVKTIQSERLKNYATALAILLGALPALIVSIVTSYRGEPMAEKTWETLRDQVNRQSVTINKLHLRLVHFQGTQEGHTAADIQHKLDQLQEKYDALLTGKPDPVQNPTTCRPGRVFAGGKCRAVSQAVDDLVKRKDQEVEIAEQKARDEMKKRLVEQRKRINQQSAGSKAPPSSLLKSLPKRLDDAAEK